MTQDLYILGARCFSQKINGKNKFLDITPEKYRTLKFYFALCPRNDTKVMEDISENILTTDFLVGLLVENNENIRCFSEVALEKELPIIGKSSVKFWQLAILRDGWTIKNIPLNDERVEFFLSRYAKDSPEYRYAFENHYKRYLLKKIRFQNPKMMSNIMTSNDFSKIKPLKYVTL